MSVGLRLTLRRDALTRSEGRYGASADGNLLDLVPTLGGVAGRQAAVRSGTAMIAVLH